MDTLKFSVRLRELRALRLFASNDESRFALNGVRVELIKGKPPILIGCDGRRMLVWMSEFERGESDPCGSFTIHSSFIDRLALIQPLGSALDQVDLTVCGEQISARLEGQVLSVSKGIITQDYPNWRGALPAAPTAPLSDEWFSVNGEYFASYPQAASILGASSPVSLKLRLRGAREAIEITCPKLPDFFGCVMPINDCGTFEKPKWI